LGLCVLYGYLKARLFLRCGLQALQFSFCGLHELPLLGCFSLGVLGPTPLLLFACLRLFGFLPSRLRFLPSCLGLLGGFRRTLLGLPTSARLILLG